MNQIDQLLAVSNFTGEFVREKWGRESTTLYPPCPVELYSDTHLPREDLVVTVGRISPEKRMELFLDIARALPRVKFVIVGSLSLDRKAYYEALRASAPDNLSIVVSPLRMAKETLGRAKVYVHCAQNEHFGITIVEAMAAGCVPVVHDSGGPREIVSPDTGLRWNSLNEAIEQISALIEDDRSRRRFSTTAVSNAKRFGPEEFESGLRKLILSILE